MYATFIGMKTWLSTACCWCMMMAFYPSQGQKLVSGYVKVGKLQVYYERAGHGPAVVLLHAGLQDHTMWEPQVKVLSAKYDVITPDLPFHGLTTGNDTSVLAKDVVKALLDELHIQKAFIVGLSMGSSVAEDFIIAYPKRVRKAVLMSAGINGYDKIHNIDSVSSDWYYRFQRALNLHDTALAALEFTKAWAQGVYRASDSLKAPVSQFVYRTTLDNLRIHKMAGSPLLENHPPAMERIISIRLPVLVIDGDQDLPYIGVTSLYLDKRIRLAHRVTIKGAAHMLNMEKPKEVNQLLLKFFAGTK